MEKQVKTPASFSWGIVILFVPIIIGGLSLLGILPAASWVQIATVLVIIGCVGVGTYLVFWGKRPRRHRGDWLPSDTLPKSDSR